MPSTIIRKKGNIIPSIISILAQQTVGFTKLDLSVMHADAISTG
jgi:hypothetical protein